MQSTAPRSRENSIGSQPPASTKGCARRCAGTPSIRTGSRKSAAANIEITINNSMAQSRTRRRQQPHQTPLSPLATQIRLIYADKHIVVIDKPAGLTTVRHAQETKALGRKARRYMPPTLVDLLPQVLPA